MGHWYKNYIPTTVAKHIATSLGDVCYSHQQQTIISH